MQASVPDPEIEPFQIPSEGSKLDDGKNMEYKSTNEKSGMDIVKSKHE